MDCFNDGRVDLYVTGMRANTLYRNRGDGTFEDVTARAGVGGDGDGPVAAAWLDYDNDGWVDLFVVRSVAWDPTADLRCGTQRPGMRGYCHPEHFPPLPNALYHNQRDGTFGSQALPGLSFHRGAAFGDFNRDGRIDVALTRLNDSPVVLVNDTAGTGHWLELQLIGTKSNRDGIGAWVHAVSDSGEQWNRVTTSVG